MSTVAGALKGAKVTVEQWTGWIRQLFELRFLPDLLVVLDSGRPSLPIQS